MTPISPCQITVTQIAVTTVTKVVVGYWSYRRAASCATSFAAPSLHLAGKKKLREQRKLEGERKRKREQQSPSESHTQTPPTITGRTEFSSVEGKPIITRHGGYIFSLVSRQRFGVQLRVRGYRYWGRHGHFKPSCLTVSIGAGEYQFFCFGLSSTGFNGLLILADTFNSRENHDVPFSIEAPVFIRNQLLNGDSNRLHQCIYDVDVTSDSQWPARLLRIEPRGIVSSVEFEETMRGEFAALSYCWGTASELEKNPPFKALTSNLQQLRSGVPASMLPRTIREAVLVCTNLDIRFIWVDSLCILQDSESDWQRESTKMETICSLSKVTIIAASSTSCHSGFLGELLDSINLFTSKEPDFQISARDAYGTGFHGDPTDRNDPLEDRG